VSDLVPGSLAAAPLGALRASLCELSPDPAGIDNAIEYRPFAGFCVQIVDFVLGAVVHG
jgi:hypothetical protein